LGDAKLATSSATSTVVANQQSMDLGVLHQDLEDMELLGAPDVDSSEVVAAIERMQEPLSVKNVVIQRGMYPLMDAMMDDNFSILQQELEYCSLSQQRWQQQGNRIPRRASIPETRVKSQT
jgi:hypothetical protein